jgi:hypothetical protein
MSKGLKVQSKTALEFMRAGSRLVELHSKSGFEWWVVPGGYVSNETAIQIKQHPRVVGQRDGLFPGLDQTWRMASFVNRENSESVPAHDSSGVEAVTHTTERN